MANRHLSRSIVLQSLFEWDFRNALGKEVAGIIKRNIDEFAPGLPDPLFVYNVAELVLDKKDTLDEIIARAAPEWPLDKISIIDRNVLRVGLAELLFSDRTEVPAKVAINEAIELAKTFGGENSGRFVNGVLGTVYKEIGEPGKDETSKKEKLDPAKMPKEFLGGAVVYRKHKETVSLALVHDVFGYWTLSKGHIEEGEDIEAGTKREIKEELGITISIQKTIGENEYTASDPEKGKIRKHVYYFLAETKEEKLTLASSGGLTEARWFLLDEIASLKIYDDILPIITKGLEYILTEKR